MLRYLGLHASVLHPHFLLVSVGTITASVCTHAKKRHICKPTGIFISREREKTQLSYRGWEITLRTKITKQDCSLNLAQAPVSFLFCFLWEWNYENIINIFTIHSRIEKRVDLAWNSEVGGSHGSELSVSGVTTICLLMNQDPSEDDALDWRFPCLEIKLHILEWPFIIYQPKAPLCTNHTVKSASWYVTPVRWMDYLGKGEVHKSTDLKKFVRNIPNVYVQKVFFLSIFYSNSWKMGVKTKVLHLNFCFSVDMLITSQQLFILTKPMLTVISDFLIAA